MPRILRQFLPNSSPLPYVKTTCNSTPVGHLHSCWQEQQLYHWPKDQPKENHQEYTFHFLFTLNRWIHCSGGSSPECEIKQSSCVHLTRGCYYKKITLLKRFLSNFQTSTRLFSELIKCSIHANSYEFRYFTYFSWEHQLPLTLNLHHCLSFCPRNVPLPALKLPWNLSNLNLTVTIFTCSLTRCFNMLSPC